MSRIRAYAREPLLHFLAIGAVLFLLFSSVADPVAERAGVITVSAQDIEQLAALWRKRWERPPTAEELEGLIESRIREEVLYREALALGLDRDDTIVRRRMTQKMEFLFGDLTTTNETTDEELQAFVDAHPERFMQPPSFSFRHVYLNPEKRGEQTLRDAARLRDDLARNGAEVDPLTLGDATLLDVRFNDISDREVAAVLGTAFARELTRAPVGEWHGPIESAYGVHVVLLENREEARLPPLAEIRDRVRGDLVDQRRTEANETVYRRLRERYAIHVERPPEVAAARGGQ